MSQNLVVASRLTLLAAAEKIASCEACNPSADIEFGLIINFVKDANPKETLFYQTNQARK